MKICMAILVLIMRMELERKAQKLKMIIFLKLSKGFTNSKILFV